MTTTRTHGEPVPTESASIAADQLAQFQELFPHVFAEGKVDWDKLRAALGDLADDRPERYTFTWAGKRDAKWYEMRQILDKEQVELFAKHIVSTDDAKEKSLYDLVPCDSKVEVQFVRDLEARDDVRLYLKLPYWFTVPTPVGEYHPDWAIVMDGPEQDGKPVLYFVAETKDSIRQDDLRPDEWRKIQCGAAHFGSKQFKKKGALEGRVDYKLVTSAAELP